MKEIPKFTKEELSALAENWGMCAHPDETDEEFRSRILHKLQPETQVGTKDHFTTIHADLVRNDVPVGVQFGPLMFLGYHHRFSKLLTRIAFWLLRKARWELVSSEWE